MLFAPIINKALDSCESAKAALGIVLPVFMLVFFWNWIAPEAAVTLRTRLPSPDGFGSPTFLSLVGIYVMARFGHKWLDGKMPEKKFILIALCVCLAIVSLDPRLARNCSPFALLTSASLVRDIRPAVCFTRNRNYCAIVVSGLPIACDKDR